MKTKAWLFGIALLSLAAQTGAAAWAQEAIKPLEPVACQRNTQRCQHSEMEATKGKADSGAACPCVYGNVEFLFLERSNSSATQDIIVQAQSKPATTDLSTSDLDFDFDPALRVVVGHRLHDGWALEGSYLGLCDAEDAVFREAPGAESVLTFPGKLGLGANVFSDIDRVWVNYSSALHSAELNLVCCCGCCTSCDDSGKTSSFKGECDEGGIRCRTVEWLAGFRYLNLGERLNIYAERGQVPTEGETPQPEQGVYDIRTSNHLFGAQFGVRARRWRTKLGWEATGKAGIFGNGAQQEQCVLDYPLGEPGEFPLRPETSAAHGQVAFVGELNLTGIYRLNDVWNLRGGYNLIWIAGVALAPDQLDFRGTLPAGDHLDSNGSVLLHGVSCGVEARW